MRNKWIFLLVYLFTFSNGKAQYWFPWDQDYISEKPPILKISPEERILLFANSPFQRQPRSIRLLVPQKTIEQYLDGGEFLPASEELWEKISKIQLTMPRYIHERHPMYFSGPLLVDPCLYTLTSRGVFLTTKDKLYFWQIVNNEYLYLTDGKASALVKSKSPVVFAGNWFPEASPVRWNTTSPPRKVSRIVQEPLWLSDHNSPDDPHVAKIEKDIKKVKKTLTGGEFIPVMPFRHYGPKEEEGEFGFINIPVNENNAFNEATKKWIDDTFWYDPPVGVAVFDDKHIVYWYAPKDRSVVLVWNFDGRNGIVGDLQSVLKKKVDEGKEEK